MRVQTSVSSSDNVVVTLQQHSKLAQESAARRFVRNQKYGRRAASAVLPGCCSVGTTNLHPGLVEGEKRGHATLWRSEGVKETPGLPVHHSVHGLA
eukprot:scaffold99911_cov72-Phaeocystis_antarctica.AAC.1